MATERLLPCQHCGDAWIYASTGDYGSGYEAHGYRVECVCGHAWKALNNWYNTKAEATREWNKIAMEW